MKKHTKFYLLNYRKPSTYSFNILLCDLMRNRRFIWLSSLNWIVLALIFLWGEIRINRAGQ